MKFEDLKTSYGVAVDLIVNDLIFWYGGCCWIWWLSWSEGRQSDDMKINEMVEVDSKINSLVLILGHGIPVGILELMICDTKKGVIF